MSTSHNMKLQVAGTAQLHLDQSISMVEPAKSDILNKMCPYEGNTQINFTPVLDPKYVGTTIVQNAGSYMPSGTALHPRRSVCSAMRL
jgi:hypothetical protein